MKIKPFQRLILIGIKSLHTLVWVFFVMCIVMIPLAACRELFGAVVLFSFFVLVECLVLLVNQGRCPLTDAAARYSTEQAANFDIYLPAWLARHNKLIFGVLFGAGELFALTKWIATRP